MDSPHLLDQFLEPELLASVAQQDAEAFTRLYEATAAVLFGVAKSILRDPEQAEDVLQEVYTQVWNKAETFDPALGKPIAWMIAVTRNKARDRLRSSKRRDLAMQELADSPTLKNTTAAPASAGAENKEVITIVQKALKAFPPAQRRALELSLFHGLSHAEVAEVTREPIGTVKAWIRRGMIELRNRLRNYL